jgi:hypothetical protein
MEIVPWPDDEPFGDPDMIDSTADPLDTAVEDADLLLGWDDEGAA